MEIPVESFAAIKLMRKLCYTERNQITATGIYYNVNTKTFDCWSVNGREKIMVTQLSENLGLADKSKKLFKEAQIQINKYEARKRA